MRGILQRVDQAFKRRKDENAALAMSVADQENHLAYLERQMQKQSEGTTTLSIALSNANKAVDEVGKGIDEFGQNDLNGLTKLMEEFRAVSAQCK